MSQALPVRESLDLSGSWQLTLSCLQGLDTDLPPADFGQSLLIPGTTDTNGLGVLNEERHMRQLTRRHLHVGPAWYRRVVEIPPHWEGGLVELFIERTKPSRLWLDGAPVGGPLLSVYTPHRHPLGPLSPGPHVLVLCVDNAFPLPVSGHALSEATQTNWNGLLGRVELRRTPLFGISSARISLAPGGAFAQVGVQLRLPAGLPRTGSLHVRLAPFPFPAAASGTDTAPGSPALMGSSSLEKTFALADLSPDGTGTLTLALPGDFAAWDEYNPALWTLSLCLEGAAGEYPLSDYTSQVTGLRDFRREGSHLLSAGRRVFLRGKHDCCAFPLTGHPPMDEAFWDAYFATCRDYGLNHVRFHSWTPPAAAFTAADRAGIFLLPELPFWGVLPDPSQPGLEAYLEQEGRDILDTYGNHPSFCLFSLGNETGGRRETLASLVSRLRAHDSRPLYASGTNAFFNSPGEQPGDDFWVTMRTRPGPAGRTRASYSHADLPLGHIETEGPGTRHDFSASAKGFSLPLIGHETGQYQFYPDYDEIALYTGVLEARNLEQYAESLRRAGLWDQRHAFFRAAGAQALRCYREDIEAALRTPSWSGFQLLDLQDYPGQGTALIGVLNVFMRSKGLISPAEWRRFCSDTVPLLRMDRHVWETGSLLVAELQLAHYGVAPLVSAALHWRLLGPSGSPLLQGSTTALDLSQGALHTLGRLELPLPALPAPSRCELELTLAGTDRSGTWPLWVFPPATPVPPPPPGLLLTRILDSDTLAALEAGARVLLFPAASSLPNSLAPLFMTDFWCYPMFKRVCDQYALPPSPGTMGLLIDPAHPALALFPTGESSDWQWWHLVMAGRPMILDGAPASLRPLVQVIDNFDRNHRLGLLFECRVGRGSLLVCSIDPERIAARPEGSCLLHSLHHYVASDAFSPSCVFEGTALRQLLHTPNPAFDETPRERVVLTAEEAAQGPGAAVLG